MNKNIFFKLVLRHFFLGAICALSILCAPAFAEGEGGGAFGGDPRLDSELYIRLDRLVVPVVQERDLKATYILETVIRAKDRKAALRLRFRRPILLDALYSDVYGVLNVVWDKKLHIDLQDLKKRILRILNESVKEPLVEEVFIQVFQRQEMR